MKIDLSPSVIDRFEQQIQTSRALNYLLFCAHIHNEPLKNDSDGIHTLLETQVDLFAGILASIEIEWDRSKAKPDAGQAAIDRQSAKHEAELTNLTPAEMREKFIADNARRGVGVPAIAEALNMKEAAVTNLVAQLLGTEAAAEPSSRKPAVNE